MITTPAAVIVPGGWAAGGCDCISRMVGALVFSWTKAWELPPDSSLPAPPPCCVTAARDAHYDTGDISTKVTQTASSLSALVPARIIRKPAFRASGNYGPSLSPGLCCV